MVRPKKEKSEQKEMIILKTLFVKGPIHIYEIHKELEKEFPGLEYSSTIRLMEKLRKEGIVKEIGVEGKRKRKIHQITVKGISHLLYKRYIDFKTFFNSISKSSPFIRACLKLGLIPPFSRHYINYLLDFLPIYMGWLPEEQNEPNLIEIIERYEANRILFLEKWDENRFTKVFKKLENLSEEEIEAFKNKLEGILEAHTLRVTQGADFFLKFLKRYNVFLKEKLNSP